MLKQRRKIQALNQACDLDRDSYKKSLTLFLTVTGVFVFCWAPFVIQGYLMHTHTAVTKSTTGCSFFWPCSTVVSTFSSTLGRTRTSKPLIGVYCSTVVNQNMRSAEFFIIWGEERSKGFTTRVSSWIIVDQNTRSAEFFIISRKKKLHNTCLFLDSCEHEVC